MDCVKHPGVVSAAFCQNCGKAICKDCVTAGVLRPAAMGQILCPDCIDQRMARPGIGYVPLGESLPNPGLAMGLGFIPGVGAMYNGQLLKGLMHVFIFAVLCGFAGHWDFFGFLVAAWIAYQVFDAYHTAKAKRAGEPLPDPLGLNDLSGWIGVTPRPPQHPGAVPPPVGQPAAQQPKPDATFYQYPNQPPFRGPMPGPMPGWQPAPGSGFVPGQPFDAVPPGMDAGMGQGMNSGMPGAVPPIPPIPPMPPMPPVHSSRRPEPIGAIVLIALGVLFLLGQWDLFSFHALEYLWPLLLIALGVWLIVHRITEDRGGQE